MTILLRESAVIPSSTALSSGSCIKEWEDILQLFDNQPNQINRQGSRRSKYTDRDTSDGDAPIEKGIARVAAGMPAFDLVTIDQSFYSRQKIW